MKRETVYGQAATGNYLRMPFNRCNLGSEQGLIDEPGARPGARPAGAAPGRDQRRGGHRGAGRPSLSGLWLTGLFGDSTTDNLDGSWDHVFGSGADDLPSYTVEVGMPKVPA